MKDTRDPESLYLSIVYEKTAWNCSILEAADRVELERVHQTARVPTERGWMRVGMPPENGREEGVQ